MKVLLLSDAHSIHTVKWAKSLSKKGIEIAVFSLNFNENEANPYQNDINVKVYYCVDKNAKKRMHAQLNKSIWGSRMGK